MLRKLANLSVDEVARRGGIARSTVRALESGKTVSARSIRRLLDSLELSFDEVYHRDIEVLTDQPFVVHRPDVAVWYAIGDTRRSIPPDNQRMIQDPAERLRLARLGFVEYFFCPLTFVMPNGPGCVYYEPCKKMGAINMNIYRDAILHCLRGAVQFQMGGESTILREGDAVGYDNDQEISITPIEGLSPEFQLPLLLWVGANRRGKLDHPDGATRRGSD